MKTIYKKLLLLLLLLPISVLAQSVSGTVTEKSTGLPLPGVSVVVQGTTNGTSTDIDGKFMLTNLKTGNTLVFSYIGYENITVAYTGQQTINASMAESASELQEVVVQVGYGTVRKKDATGSITTVTTKDFNKGAIVSADQLLQGKAAGVRITTNGGEPDSAPNIRIRGGASLSANNNPLIVIDGIPVDIVTPAGVGNPLSLVNPNDIESVTVLKDASAAAIYGSRASNGVLIITTKKGSSGKMQFNMTSNFSVGTVGKKVDVMDGPTFTRFIQQYHATDANGEPTNAYTNLLGIDDPNSNANDDPTTPEIEGRRLYNTDWQDVIYRTAVTIDHNFSARGNLGKSKIPFRGSVGYTRNEGLVKTSNYDRLTASLKLTPSLFQDHLKIDVNAKTVFAVKNEINQDGAIGGALNMDPTKPVYDPYGNTKFGGYYQQTLINGNYDKIVGSTNPLAILEQRRHPNTSFRFLGNAQFDYKLHFLPDLHAIVNVGLDANRAQIKEIYNNNAIAAYSFNTADPNPATNYLFNGGKNYQENQTLTNTTMESYLSYGKDFKGIVNRLDVQGGYSYQNFKNDGIKQTYMNNTVSGIREQVLDDPTNKYFNELNLQSFFGRANIDFSGKYLVTLSFRADGSSLFTEDNRWGYFPAAAVAWRISEEGFLKGKGTVNDLKLRLGAGKTGQQDITQIAGYYPSIPLFEVGSNQSQYLSGANLYSAKFYNPDLTWEKTITYNVGLDWDLFKNSFFTGSFDIYKRETTDLLAIVPIPAGQALSDTGIKNVGDTESKGFELTVGLRPISTDKATLQLSGNIAYNRTEVTGLQDVTSITDANSRLPFQTGLFLSRHAVGFQPTSAWVYQQLYDANGQAIVGSYVDRNGDNQITDADRYYKALRPNWTFGFALNFNYGNWDLSTSFRGQLDGYVYNSLKANFGNIDRAVPANSNALSNVLNFYDGAANPDYQNLNSPQLIFTDYFLEKAAFLRCENIVLGYKFNKFYKESSLRLYGSVTNPFIITKYNGQDPENFNGIDNNAYPRPRMYGVGLSLDF